MEERILAGPETDERLGTLLGVAPKIMYFASADGGQSGMIFSRHRVAVKSWIDGQKERFPDSASAKCQVCTSKRWPAYSSEAAAGLQLVEALRDRGWLVVMKLMPDGHPFIVEGSRSEYDAPAPDRPAWLRATAELVWMNIDTREDLRRRIHGHHFGAVTVEELVHGADPLALAVARAALSAEAEIRADLVQEDHDG